MMLGGGVQSPNLLFKARSEYYKALQCWHDCLFDAHCYFHAVHSALLQANKTGCGWDTFGFFQQLNLCFVWGFADEVSGWCPSKALTKYATAEANKRKKKKEEKKKEIKEKKRHGNVTSKIMYGCKDMRHWELLLRTICFERNYCSGNHFRNPLLMPTSPRAGHGVWMRKVQHPSAFTSCSSCRQAGAFQGLWDCCSPERGIVIHRTLYSGRGFIAYLIHLQSRKHESSIYPEI